MSAPSVKSVSKDVILYVPGRVIPALMQALTIVILTRLFLPAEIGRYDLTFRLTLFLSTFTILWLNMAILRFYPAYTTRGQEREFFGVMGRLKYLGILIGLITGTVMYFVGPDSLCGSYRDLILAGLCMFAAYSLYETGMAVLRAKRRPGFYSIASAANSIVRLPVAVGIILALKTGIAGLLWGTTIVYLITHALVMRRHVGRPVLRLNHTESGIQREILYYGLPVCLTQLFNFFILNSDRFLLKVLQDDAHVGLYAVATNLVDQPMMLVLQTFTLAVFPSVAAAWETEGRVHTEHLVNGVTRLFFLVCLPLMVFLGFFAGPVFQVLAGGASYHAYVAAPWVAIGSLFYGLSYFASFGLHLSKKTYLLTLMTVMAVGLNFLLNCVVIPQYGFVGAAMVRILSNAVLVVSVAAVSHRYLHWRIPVLSTIRILLAAGVAGASLLPVAHRLSVNFVAHTLAVNLFTLALLFSLAGTLYAVFLLLLREVPWSDVRALRRWLKLP